MKLLLILFIAFGLFVFGCISFDQKAPPQNDSSKTSNLAANTSLTSNSSIQKSIPQNIPSSSNSSISAPSTTPQSFGYSHFSLDKYNLAKREGKFIFLEFYANWCPTCASQKPAIESAFASLSKTNSKIVGFQVNYRDSETDENELLLAKDLGISTQHTHIILDPKGSVVFRSNEFLDSDQIQFQIMKLTG